MEQVTLTTYSFVAIATLLVVYFFLITEKVNKVIVALLGGTFLILTQLFKTAESSSQAEALHFIGKNLDVLFFIIGMMILVGIVKESGFFEAVAIWLVKKVKGNPKKLLIIIGYMTLFMTMFLSNIPTVLIMLPVLLVLIRELKLPYLPYLITVVTMANIGGAATPFSDPTTYYQAKTVGLSFGEVVTNSGMIVMVLSVVSTIYLLMVFNKSLSAVNVNPKDVAKFNPALAIKDKGLLYKGMPLLVISIVLMSTRELIANAAGVSLDNATIALAGAFLASFLFKKEPRELFRDVVDWEIIFFFAGLFIVVGALEHTHVVAALANGLVTLSGGNSTVLQFLLTMGSGLLSMFIDNVPYNITMVGAIQAMEKAGIVVYPLWWALNLGTSLGGAGSPIGAACNVVALGQAEKEKIHVKFMKYLMVGAPLVVINALVTFGILWIRYAR
jgi:Na+/H+ antiporter NhaD/arsenite permease-like protein